MLYGVALGLLRRYPDRRPAPPGAGLLLLFVFTYAGIHILSWALIRYRLPVDAVLLSFAGLGIVDMADRVRLRSRSAPSSDAVAVPARE
jgi:hypothetical protein